MSAKHRLFHSFLIKWRISPLFSLAPPKKNKKNKKKNTVRLILNQGMINSLPSDKQDNISKCSSFCVYFMWWSLFVTCHFTTWFSHSAGHICHHYHSNIIRVSDQPRFMHHGACSRNALPSEIALKPCGLTAKSVVNHKANIDPLLTIGEGSMNPDNLKKKTERTLWENTSLKRSTTVHCWLLKADNKPASNLKHRKTDLYLTKIWVCVFLRVDPADVLAKTPALKPWRTPLAWEQIPSRSSSGLSMSVIHL